MVKKVLGWLFFVAALLLLIGAIANGTLFSDKGSAAATYGNFIGTVLPIVVYVLSGIYLLAFDNPTKLNYIEGFKKRSKQSLKTILFIIAYAVFIMITAYGVGLSGTDNYVLAYIIAIIPYIIPLFIFVYVYLMCCAPYQASKKYFLKNDAEVNEYISENETFVSYTSDNFVMASDKALFFPGLSCVVPFDQIVSVQLVKQLWEQDVYFYLQNGKKFYVMTKHFETIKKLVEDKKNKQ